MFVCNIVQMTDTADSEISYVLWAHHVNDPSWTNASYIRLFECTTVTEFWQLVNSLRHDLNSLFQTHMLFLMKKVGNVEIYPKWEDERNINGGCWSLRVERTQAVDHFIELAKRFVTHSLTKRPCGTNGLSMAPKKIHNILKIWMDAPSKTGVEWYIPNVLDTIPLLKKAVFQVHNNNIKRDYRRKAFFQTNRTVREKNVRNTGFSSRETRDRNAKQCRGKNRNHNRRNHQRRRLANEPFRR